MGHQNHPSERSKHRLFTNSKPAVCATRVFTPPHACSSTNTNPLTPHQHRSTGLPLALDVPRCGSAGAPGRGGANHTPPDPHLQTGRRTSGKARVVHGRRVNEAAVGSMRKDPAGIRAQRDGTLPRDGLIFSSIVRRSARLLQARRGAHRELPGTSSAFVLVHPRPPSHVGP